MSQLGVVLHASREDLLFAPGSQGQANTAALFIYSGEVSCNFSSQGATSLSDQLIILLEPNFTSTTQIVGGLNVNPSIPLVVPTSWNANNRSVSSRLTLLNCSWSRRAHLPSFQVASRVSTSWHRSRSRTECC